MPDESRPGQLTPLSLLARARANDQDAWARLASLYRPLVAFWCRRARCPAEEVEDVTQEVFAGAAAGLAGFRRDRPGDSFRGWLRGITRNQVLLYFRSSRGHTQPVGGSGAMGRIQDLPDTLVDCAEEEAAEVSQLYRRAVGQVRGEFQHYTWDVFWRIVIDGCSPTTLAEELGTTPAAVRQAKSRVLRRLKQEMGEVLE
jgi:RNA polymerase sigma-70 factor (ECF subfamily)